jgi:signal transduction histidine kinase
MVRRLLFALLILLGNSLFSQNNIENAEERFEELAEKIRKSTYFDSASVFNYGQKALVIADSIKDLSKRGKIYQYYGNFNYYSGRMKTALEYYDTTLIFANKASDTTLINSTKIRKTFIGSEKGGKMEAEKKFLTLLKDSERRKDYKNALESLNGLGIIAEDRNDQGKAIEYYLKAYGYAEKLDDLYLRGMLLNNIGLIKFRNAQYDDALTDFKKGLVFSDSIDNFRLSFNLQNNIGLLYEKTDETEKSIEHFEQTLTNANRLGFPLNIAVTHLNLSNSYILNKQFDSALEHADSAILIFNQIADYRHIAKPYLLKALVHRKTEELSKSRELVDSALYLAKNYKNTEDVVQGIKFKSEILKELGEFEESLRLFERYYEMNDSIDDISSQERFAQLQVAYETERKEAELKEEKARTTMLEKDNKLKESRIVIIAVVGVFLIIGTILFFYLRHLRLTRSQQRSFSQKLIANLDEERSRISRDLHDDIGQSLSVAKSKINLYNKGQITDLSDLESGLGEVIQQARNLSHQLHPSYLEKIGLNRSIKSLLDRVEKSSGVITSCELESRIDDLDLTKQTQLYRILQECLNNTLKHAEAKSVKCSIQKSEGEYRFLYQDNGKGFDVNEQRFGLGMMTIKERAQKIDGKLTVISHLQKGFKLIIKFN